MYSTSGGSCGSRDYSERHKINIHKDNIDGISISNASNNNNKHESDNSTVTHIVNEQKEEISSSDSGESSSHYYSPVKSNKEISNTINETETKKQNDFQSLDQCNDNKVNNTSHSSVTPSISISPTKPVKPVKRSLFSSSSSSSSSNFAAEVTMSTDNQRQENNTSINTTNNIKNTNDSNFPEISITVTTPERDLVTYGTEAATYYLGIYETPIYIIKKIFIVIYLVHRWIK
jgi:hypothetical protein